MNIDPINSRTTTSSIAANTGTPSTGFRELFELAKSGTPSTSSNTALSGASGKTESAHETAVRELREYLSKTPEQRMREAILKSMGVTEEDIKNMPPEQQAAIEAAIKEKVKEKLLEQAQSNADAAVGKAQAGNGVAYKLPMF